MMYFYFASPSIKWFLIIVELEKATGHAGLVFSVTLGGRPDLLSLSHTGLTNLKSLNK